MESILSATIAVVGLGYVGLPLAVAFGRKFRTIGYDLSEKKIAHFKNHTDPTGEVTTKQFRQAVHLTLTSKPRWLQEADIVVVAVPTPIDESRRPDLGPVKSATETVGRNLREGAIVVFESTVYPGLTEEVCVPILEQESGFRWKQHFHVGYSPERINPGDREHTLERIVKVVSGDDEETLQVVASVYEQIVDAGVYRAGSIKEAEAAKVIENTQRDLNIALVNELAVIFDRLGIDTTRVLEAAGTKWNFLPFRPGLVGGHCIGVDPYYLTHKAETLGYHPQVILAGRRINDGMGKFIAEKAVKMMIQSGMNGKGARAGVLGLTFKEDCPDLRNSKVVDIIRELESYGIDVLVHDPVADGAEAEEHYGIRLEPWENIKDLSAIILAVAHRVYRQWPASEYLSRLAPGGCLLDVKSILDPEEMRKSGTSFWRL
ncbi:MAG: nucleotide sugar dehydrogenase [Rubrivivax sp.]|nr:nucleotide sugar dehydrogenase [Rubrivivax sp.]